MNSPWKIIVVIVAATLLITSMLCGFLGKVILGIITCLSAIAAFLIGFRFADKERESYYGSSFKTK